MIVTISLPQVAVADYTLFYTGNPFNLSLCPAGTVVCVAGNIALSITIPGEFPNDYTGNLDITTATSVNLTVGGVPYRVPPVPMPNGNQPGYFVDIILDAGQITGWLVTLCPSNVPESPPTISNITTTAAYSANSNGFIYEDYIEIYENVDGLPGLLEFGKNSNDPGTWTLVSPALPPPPPLFTALQQRKAAKLASKIERAHLALDGAGIGYEIETVARVRGVAFLMLGFIFPNDLYTASFLSGADVAVSCEGISLGALTPGCAIAGIGVGLTLWGAYELGVAGEPSQSQSQSPESGAAESSPPIYPFDPNYQQVFVPTIETSPLPLIPSCTDLTKVAQATTYTVDRAMEWLNAIYVTNNRYMSAMEVGDTTSASLQSATFQGYVSSYNTAIDVAKTDLTCLASLLTSAGIGISDMTQQQETEGLNDLASTNVNILEEMFGSTGISAAELTALISTTESRPPPLPSETAVNALTALVDDLKPL